MAAGCRACGGVWIDHIVSRLVVTGSLSDSVKAFLRHIGEAATGPAPAGYRTAARRDERLCPVCREGLTARPYGSRPTTLDVCGMHGAYFDLRELDGILFDVDMRAAVAEAADHVAEATEAHRRNEVIFSTVLGVAGALLASQHRPRRY